jgi:S1-C subfamily serine protease
MRITNLLLFIVVFLVSCSSQQKVPQIVSDEKLFLIKNSTAALIEYVEEIDTIKPHCTSVWLSQDIMITAYHCVAIDGDDFDANEEKNVKNEIKFVVYSDIGNNMNIENDDPIVFKGKVIATDRNNDLAIIQSNRKDLVHSFVKISKEKLYEGAFVEVVGHTVGIMYTYSVGHISAERLYKGPFPEPVKLLQITVPIGPGNSGGGVFLNKELVGIVSFGPRRASHILFAIHKNTIIDFLDRNAINVQ